MSAAGPVLPREHATNCSASPKQLGYADTLDEPDINLPGQHIGAIILQELLDLVHKHDKIQGIQARFN